MGNSVEVIIVSNINLFRDIAFVLVEDMGIFIDTCSIMYM